MGAEERLRTARRAQREAEGGIGAVQQRWTKAQKEKGREREKVQETASGAKWSRDRGGAEGGQSHSAAAA